MWILALSLGGLNKKFASLVPTNEWELKMYNYENAR